MATAVLGVGGLVAIPTNGSGLGARGSEAVKPRCEGFPVVCSWRQRDEGPGLRGAPAPGHAG